MKRDLLRGQNDYETRTFYPRLWQSLDHNHQERVLDKYEDLVIRIDRTAQDGGFKPEAIDRLYQAYARLRTTILGRSLREEDFWRAQADRQDPLWQAGDPNEGMPR